MLGGEFRELLPPKFGFPEEHELLGFEIASRWIGDVATYVIGIAAMLSADFDLARRLFSDLEEGLQARAVSGDTHPVLDLLQQRIGARLIEALHFTLRRQYLLFTRTRDHQHMLKCKPVLSELFQRNPGDYSGKIHQAMIYFFEGRVQDAIRELEGIDPRDATCRYNLGFLYAYIGRIDDALEEYRKASYGDTGLNVINDLEMFLTDVIERDPSKPQLYFFRGLLNFKGKPDYVLAKQDFEDFLKSAGSVNYATLVKLARMYREQSEKHIGV